MRRLISADLKRILAKPGLYVVVVLMIFFVMTRSSADTAADMINFYHTFFYNIGLTFVCIPIFLSVYADEIKSGTMIVAIGYGMQRSKLVRAKLYDCAILLSGTYLVLFVTGVLKNNLMGLPVTPKQTVFLLVFCIFCVIRGVGIFALSSLVLFASLSVAGGLLTLIIAGATASMILKAIQSYTELPVYNLSYLGLLDAAYNELQAGGISTSLIMPLLYLAVVVFANIKLFNKKELEL